MNLCVFCKSQCLNGKGCSRTDFKQFVGNKFPTGIKIVYCSAFQLVEDKCTDVKLNILTHKLYYNVTKKSK